MASISYCRALGVFSTIAKSRENARKLSIKTINVNSTVGFAYKSAIKLPNRCVKNLRIEHS